MKNKNIPYSEALSELESIIADIEGEEVTMDDLLEKVKRASFLIQHCRKKLRGVEAEVKKTLADIESDEDL